MARFLLRGRLERGMFPDESVVVVTDFQGRIVSIVVPDTAIDRHEGSVEVRVLERNDDLALVRLPGESFGPSVITVRDSDLKAAG